MLQSLAAPLASPQRPLTSSASAQHSSSGTSSAATTARPAAAGGKGAAASGAGTRKPRTKTEQLSPGMENFVKQMFTADLDALPADEAAAAAAAEGQPPQAAAAEVDQQTAAPAAGQQQADSPAAAAASADAAVAQAEAAAGAAAAEAGLDRAAAKRREKKLQRLLGPKGGSPKGYEAWLEANAEGVAAFRPAAAATLAQLAGRTSPARQAWLVEQLLVWLFRSKRGHLLEPSEAEPSKLLAQLGLEEAITLLTRTLGVHGSHVPSILERCPVLLNWRPPAETLEALQELFGGRQALGTAVQRSPSVVLMNVEKVKRRLEVLALLMHRSTREAADLAAQFPALVGCGEKQLADNARFLGTLLPLRPYSTLLQRFPYLLTIPLEGRLRGLQRHVARGAPELAALDLQLLVSQQPTLLIKRPPEVVAQWHLLSQAAAAVPAWQDELAAMAAPTSAPTSAEQQTDSEAAAAAVAESSQGEAGQLSEADQWLADMLASMPGDSSGYGAFGIGGGSGAASSEASSAASSAEGEREPDWFHRDAAGEKVAAARGAFGTQQRPWADSDRLRMRQLARLLDARRWQVLRLLYLGETVGAEAGQRSLMEVVMEQLPAFERAHPDFPDWLADQLRREEEAQRQAAEEREQRRAEWRAEQAAAAGGESAAADGEAADWSWDAAAAGAAGSELESAALPAAGDEAAADAASPAAEAAAAAQEQTGAAGELSAAGAAPQQ
ncbi:hypothetical protein C2E21_7934 [Chlorella sorokiniana]|uniref:Uncharacterized protein n=1 Tax=Chlorella sorokiniana TaxID=3076 RepID=A0A2P6TGQ9_CHLSO|nr:hypothetical protein C2E21_7934 [Chlorella sorokiniana]|eukprot:PRW33302.1 hypothetical protein C2E21_7934 [Chlorella sorokiniana]